MYLFLAVLLVLMAVILFFLVKVGSEKQPASWPIFNPLPAGQSAVGTRIKGYFCEGNRLLVSDEQDCRTEISETACSEFVSIAPDRLNLFYWQKTDGNIQLKVYNIVLKSHVQYHYRPVNATEIICARWHGDGTYRIVCKSLDEEKNESTVSFCSLFRQAGSSMYALRTGRDYVFGQNKDCMNSAYSVAPHGDWIVIWYRLSNGLQDESCPLLYYSDGFSDDRSLTLVENTKNIFSASWLDDNSFVLHTDRQPLSFTLQADLH
ncbi:MAG: hypothetical protein JW874_01275 [Spirochaetales bacterium]|nr:hypothetical protein [Spirochaetales bacterium]